MDDREAGLFRGVFLASLGTLLYEIALIRVLSFTIWYHFAYVVLSTALLGFGASGTLLAVRPTIGEEDLGRAFSNATVAAALAGAAFLGFMSLFPFDPMAILKSPRAFALMLGYQVGATVPFFFAGLAISLALRASAARVDRLYFWDLVGAGSGCAFSVWLMNVLSPPGALVIACAAFSFAGAAVRGISRGRVAVGVGLVLLAVSPFARNVPFTPAESKHLSEHLHRQRLVPIFMKWTSLFRTDVVKRTAQSAPFTNHNEWGLSAAYDQHAQAAWGFLTHDASAGAPIYDLADGPLDFLDHHILHLPYLVATPSPRVLVIGVGGGRDVLTALRYGASRITGVELDPVTVELIRSDLGALSRGAFGRPPVELVAEEGRHFVESSHERYDIIQITGVDTLAAQASGAYVLAENYLYTTEAFKAYLDHLAPRGLLSIGSGEWNPNEPQSTGRMALVARQALLDRGISNPERHIIAVSSRVIQAAILIRLEPFEPNEIARVSTETQELAFEPLLLAGSPAHPVFDALMTSVGSEREALFARLPYIIDPVTDEQPFFFRFFRWRDLFSQKQYLAVHTSALGQLVLVLLLVSLTVLAAAFIVAPLFVFLRRGLAGGRRAAGVLIYFLALGFGFMLLEISLMQRFVLYLGYPTYALSVVLLSLLLSLGVGSFLSSRWVGREGTVLPTALIGVAVLVVAYKTGLPFVLDRTLGAPLAVRIAFTVLLLAPLGVALGTFFPLGIRRAAEIHPDLVPWAWGVNGCASVTASVFAVIVAMEFGFVVVWILSLAVYAIGVTAFLTLTGAPSAAPSP
jgi:hypothetical protein